MARSERAARSAQDRHAGGGAQHLVEDRRGAGAPGHASRVGDRPPPLDSGLVRFGARSSHVSFWSSVSHGSETEFLRAGMNLDDLPQAATPHTQHRQPDIVVWLPRCCLHLGRAPRRRLAKMKCSRITRVSSPGGITAVWRTFQQARCTSWLSGDPLDDCPHVPFARFRIVACCAVVGRTSCGARRLVVFVMCAFAARPVGRSTTPTSPTRPTQRADRPNDPTNQPPACSPPEPPSQPHSTPASHAPSDTARTIRSTPVLSISSDPCNGARAHLYMWRPVANLAKVGPELVKPNLESGRRWHTVVPRANISVHVGVSCIYVGLAVMKVEFLSGPPDPPSLPPHA